VYKGNGGIRRVGGPRKAYKGSSLAGQAKGTKRGENVSGAGVGEEGKGQKQGDMGPGCHVPSRLLWKLFNRLGEKLKVILGSCGLEEAGGADCQPWGGKEKG